MRLLPLVVRAFDLQIPDGVPESIQGLAYTSPIWHTPFNL